MASPNSKRDSMRKRLLGAAVTLALCACGDGGGTTGPSIPAIAGTFVGAYTVSGFTYQAVLELVQTGASISGALTTNGGRSATLSGSLSGTRLSGSFTFTDGCAGTASATADIGNNGTRLTGSFTANDCAGTYTGTFLLDKAQGIPLTLVTATGPSPAHLAIANGRLFWSEAGENAVNTIALAGGSPVALAPKIGAPAGIALLGQEVLWLDERSGVSPSGCAGDGVIRLLKKTSADGTGTTVLGTGDACVGGTTNLVSDGTYVYWVTSTASPNTYVIHKTPVAGGTPTTVTTSSFPIAAMAVDAGSLYWMENFFPDQTAGAIRKVSLSGGSPVTLASGFTSRGETFALNATAVFYTKANSPSSDSLIEVPLAGGAPVALADLAATPQKLVADDANLYWIDGTTVSTLPVSGGSLVTLASTVNTPLDLLARANDVIWSETTGSAHGETGAVRSVPKTGGPVSVITQGGDAPRELGADASWVYWTEGGPIGLTEGFGRIARVPAGGGAALTFVSGVTSDAAPIAVSDAQVFIADGFRVKRVPVSGGKVETVAVAYDGVTSLATDGAFVYWVEGPLSNVRKAPAAGGAVTNLASVSGSGVSPGPGGPIHLQTGTVYWMTNFDAILAVPAAGGAVRVVASGLPFLSAFVVDGSSVYFSEQDSGDIERMPLSGGTATTLALGARGSYNILAVDGANLFWIDQVEIGRVPITGGAVSFIVSGGLAADPFFPASIALDAGSIYWTEPPAREIRTAQK